MIKLIDKISLYDYNPKDLEKQLHSGRKRDKKLQEDIKSNLGNMGTKSASLPNMFEKL